MADNLAIEQVAANQNQKEVTVNMATVHLSGALADYFSVDMTAGDTTLSNANFQKNMAFVLTNATGTHNFTVPAIKRALFLVRNQNASTTNVVRGSTSLAVLAGADAFFETDGTSNGLVRLSGAIGATGATGATGPTGATGATGGTGSVASLTQDHILVGDASNLPADVAMSGDVHIVASGATTVQPGVITYAKIQDVTDHKLLGRSAGSNGPTQEISIGTNLSLSAGTLSATTSSGGSVDPSPFSDGGFTKPIASGFTIADDTSTNHGTGSKVDLASRGVEFTVTQSGTPIATQSLFYKTAVSNTLNTMIAYVSPNFWKDANTVFYGLAVRDNTGKIHAFGLRDSGGANTFFDFRYTDISTVSSTASQTGGAGTLGRPIWLKLEKISTNFVFSASFNGETYFTIETVSATAFVGATLNDVGLFLVSNTGTGGTTFSIDCFSFTNT